MVHEFHFIAPTRVGKEKNRFTVLIADIKADLRADPFIRACYTLHAGTRRGSQLQDFEIRAAGSEKKSEGSSDFRLPFDLLGPPRSEPLASRHGFIDLLRWDPFEADPMNDIRHLDTPSSSGIVGNLTGILAGTRYCAKLQIS